MHSGRLKVFASLSKYLEERRLYQRDERDQIGRIAITCKTPRGAW